jgi:hypothetical protein
VGKGEVEQVDIGDVSSQEVIRISRRDAYLSSEGTAVMPPPPGRLQDVLVTMQEHALKEALSNLAQDAVSTPATLSEDDIVIRRRHKLPDEL